MVEWIHKESTWRLAGDWEHFEDDESVFMPNWDSDGPDGHVPFTQWLDSECEDGWEVLKISRNFRAQDEETWVVFRKQV